MAVSGRGAWTLVSTETPSGWPSRLRFDKVSSGEMGEAGFTGQWLGRGLARSSASTSATTVIRHCLASVFLNTRPSPVGSDSISFKLLDIL